MPIVSRMSLVTIVGVTRLDCRWLGPTIVTTPTIDKHGTTCIGGGVVRIMIVLTCMSIVGICEIRPQSGYRGSAARENFVTCRGRVPKIPKIFCHYFRHNPYKRQARCGLPKWQSASAGTAKMAAC